MTTDKPKEQADELFEQALNFISDNPNYTIGAALKLFAARKSEAQSDEPLMNAESGKE